MLVVGISGGPDLVYEKRYDYSVGFMHDAAAALIDNGKVVRAIEEERLNRIKHTNKWPIQSLRFCLDSYGIQLKDIDKLAIYLSEEFLDFTFKLRALLHPGEPPTCARSFIHQMLHRELKSDIDDDQICFVNHHLAHAMSAFALSGYKRGLILTIDAEGDNVSGMLLDSQGDRFNILHSFPQDSSLGYFYLEVIRFLGFSLFEEYKVMGLAPYGDPSRYRELFKSFYSLLPDGDYLFHMEKIGILLGTVPVPKRKDVLSQVHKDVAAALQEALEEIVFHVLRHYQEKTQHTNLCLAGGVAHNCSLNGKILYSGMFQDVFVQPAAHDAGCAIGAALCLCSTERIQSGPSRLQHVYWGTDIGNSDSIVEVLNGWKNFIDIERAEDIADRTAKLLANGSVIGWVQGRSEFGPRALGNRSVLADPRPAENKQIINEMVKKREAYRPFAPSVLEEYVDEFFDCPPNTKQFPFMTFVLKVRKEKRQILGAVTHVDGTARIQTVSRKTNPKFWELIEAFRGQTGIPVLLNTSFNNNVEPIVDSVVDAIVCFLTSKLHFLVVGDYLVRKKSVNFESYLSLVPSLHLYASLLQSKRFTSANEMSTFFAIGNSYDECEVPITFEVFNLLAATDKDKTLADLLTDQSVPREKEHALIDEVIELWSRRLVVLEPYTGL